MRSASPVERRIAAAPKGQQWGGAWNRAQDLASSLGQPVRRQYRYKGQEAEQKQGIACREDHDECEGANENQRDGY